MSKIKIEVEIDSTNAAHIAAASTFLQSLGGEKAKVPLKRKGATKIAGGSSVTAPAAEKIEGTQAAPEVEKPDAKALKAEVETLATEARGLLAQPKCKSPEVRGQIKAQLNELKAPNVTKLIEDANAKDKLTRLITFLTDLK